jgi:hypothetical protein
VWAEQHGSALPCRQPGGFDRPLPMLDAICRCPSRSKARSWPRSHGHLVNVGSDASQRVRHKLHPEVGACSQTRKDKVLVAGDCTAPTVTAR